MSVKVFLKHTTSWIEALLVVFLFFVCFLADVIYVRPSQKAIEIDVLLLAAYI